jgi:hypothetical protein
VAANIPSDRESQARLREEIERGLRIVSQIVPQAEFYSLTAAVYDSSDWERIPALVEEYLTALEDTRTAIKAELALQLLPAAAFGGAYKRGDRHIVSAHEEIQRITTDEKVLLKLYLGTRADNLLAHETLRVKFPNALKI